MQLIHELIESAREPIYATAEYLWNNPELGFFEWKAHAYLKQKFEEMGYTVKCAGNIPGFIAELDTGKPGPCVALMAEMDAVVCRDHPAADPETGAVHACGHNAQAAELIGAAFALRNVLVLDNLSGRIRFMVVPAEELQVEQRENLRKEGIIHYTSGKVEFLYRGLFDGVDIAVMIHTLGGKKPCFYFNPGSNGSMIKMLRFKGKSSHVAGPWNGINALAAATLAMNGVNAQRDTFKEQNYTRFSYWFSKGGDAVNVVPDDVRVEAQLRGASMDAIRTENDKINRTIACCAAALGAELLISDRPGDMPFVPCPALQQAMIDTFSALVAREDINEQIGYFDPGCTDIGDIACIMPCIQASVSGAAGRGHGADWVIKNPEWAYMLGAEALTRLAYDFLKDDAAVAKRILTNSNPTHTKDSLLSELDNMCRDFSPITYEENGNISVNI